MRLLIVGSQTMTDVRALRAAVRTTMWHDDIRECVVPHNGPFSTMTIRWANENNIPVIPVPLEVVRYGNRSRAAVERDETAARLATHLLLVMDYTLHHCTYWRRIAAKKKLKMFIYYTVL